MNKLGVIIGKRLVLLRESKRLSQDEFAESLGISSRALQRYEAGLRVPKKIVIEKVSEVYNVDLTDFTEGEIQKTQVPPTVRVIGKTTDLLRELIFRREKIPEDVIDMAQGFELDDEVWEEVREAFEEAIKRRKTSPKNHSLPSSNGA